MPEAHIGVAFVRSDVARSPLWPRIVLPSCRTWPAGCGLTIAYTLVASLAVACEGGSLMRGTGDQNETAGSRPSAGSEGEGTGGRRRRTRNLCADQARRGLTCSGLGEPALFPPRASMAGRRAEVGAFSGRRC